MKTEKIVEAIIGKNYEIVDNTSCQCTIDWDVGRDGTLCYSATGEDCWAYAELVVDGMAVFAWDVSGDGGTSAAGHESALLRDLVDLPAPAGNAEHEANVRAAFVDFASERGLAFYARHPRGFSNEYTLYCRLPSAGAENIPADAQPVSAEDVADHYLARQANGAIADSTDVVVVD